MDAGASQHIHSNYNTGNIAGRDLYLGNQYVVQETDYFEPTLEEVESPDWTGHLQVRELARSLSSRRLLLLSGHGLDLGKIARSVAWHLREILRSCDSKVHVREWWPSSDPQKLETALHKEDTTILLLPQALPYHVGHRLNALADQLHRRAYAVLTTAIPRDQWLLEGPLAEPETWHDLSWETFYGVEFLSDLLIRKIPPPGPLRPEGVLPAGDSEAGPDTPLVEGLTVREAVAKLKQPDRIAEFVLWLLRQEPPLRLAEIQERLEILSGEGKAIEQWFREADRSEQLFALALSLFDGLADDQVFAALEGLVAGAWRSSDPLLAHFDYRDLDRVCTYFHLVDAGEDGTRIETQARDRRRDILRAAWKLQRRRLLAALPAITGMIKRSVRSAASEETPEGSNTPSPGALAAIPAWGWRPTPQAERELYGNPRRKRQLQQALIESLSGIALLSPTAAEPCLMELATDNSEGVQEIVAKALAAWRESDDDERLWKLMSDWWKEGVRKDRSRSLLLRLARKETDPFASLRATVALIAGYASRYDRSNHLAPHLVALLGVLVQDRDPVVREHFLDTTLPLAVAWHLRQLERQIREKLLVDNDVMLSVALGIAMGYPLRGEEIVEVLDFWRATARTEQRTAPDHVISPRERLLATIALSYGYLHFEKGEPNPGPLSPGDVFARLRALMTEESHPFVRNTVLLSMGLQAIHSFELAAPVLQQLVSAVTLTDRAQVVAIFTRAYLSQREHMEGGDDLIEIDGEFYPVWLRSERPLTAMEALLYEWLHDAGDPVAQQIAVQTFASIAATQLEQQERELSAKPQVALQAPAPVVYQVSGERIRTLWLLGLAAVFLSEPRRKEVRATLRALLAELVVVGRATAKVSSSVAQGMASSAMSNVRIECGDLLRRWRSVRYKGTDLIARRLEVAFGFYRWRWPLAAIAFYLLFTLGNNLLAWIEAARQPEAVTDPQALYDPSAPTGGPPPYTEPGLQEVAQ